MSSFEHLYNRHFAETCLVIGNGPSLRDVPLDFLKKYPSFGTNRIYLLNGFTPRYYVAVNPLVVEQSAEEIKAVGSELKFICESRAHLVEGAHGLVSSGHAMFSFNPAAYVYEGFTVTFVALQLAYFMGFDTVLLVGVDHTYRTDGPPNAETVWEGDDPNHFDAAYFKGTRWNNPDLVRSAEAYALAKAAFENNGRRIINLTPNTAEPVFEKGELVEWI